MTLQDHKDQRLEAFTRIQKDAKQYVEQVPVRDTPVYKAVLEEMMYFADGVSPSDTDRMLSALFFKAKGMISFFYTEFGRGPYLQHKAENLFKTAYRKGFNRGQCEWLVRLYAGNNKTEPNLDFDRLYSRIRNNDALLLRDYANGDPLNHFGQLRAQKLLSGIEASFARVTTPLEDELHTIAYRVLEYLKTVPSARTKTVADALGIRNTQVTSAVQTLKARNSSTLEVVRHGEYRLRDGGCTLYPRVTVERSGPVYVGIFLGLKLHFAQASFDYSDHGPVPVGAEEYATLPDWLGWETAVHRYSPADFESIARNVMMFRVQPRSVYDLLRHSDEILSRWEERKRHFSGMFRDELQATEGLVDSEESPLYIAWSAVGTTMSTESFLMLCRLNGWSTGLDTVLADDPTWHRARKYERLIETDLVSVEKNCAGTLEIFLAA